MKRSTSPSTLGAGTPPRVLRALAVFGLSIAEVRIGRRSLERGCERAARRLVASDAPTALIVGPSGSGKSTLLGAIACEVEGRGGVVVRVGGAWDTEDPTLGAQWEARPIVMIPGTTLPQALGLLARVGLGEAHLLALTPAQLSHGQRARFRLALALHGSIRAAEAGRASWLLADEFTTGLDAQTALGVARAASRIVASHPGLRLVACSCEERLIDALGPAVIVRTGLSVVPRVERAGGTLRSTTNDRRAA